MTHLGQEGLVVDPHAVDAVLVHGMEEAHLLSVHVQCDAGVPSVSVLVETGSGEGRGSVCVVLCCEGN